MHEQILPSGSLHSHRCEFIIFCLYNQVSVLSRFNSTSHCMSSQCCDLGYHQSISKVFHFTWPAANGPSRTWALGCSSWTQLCQNWTRTRTETLSCRPTSLPFACPSAFSTNPTKATRCFLIKCVCISGEMCGCLCMYPFPGGWGVGKVWDDGWAGDSLPAAAVQAVFSHHGCWGGTQTPKHHMQHYY